MSEETMTRGDGVENSPNVLFVGNRPVASLSVFGSRMTYAESSAMGQRIIHRWNSYTAMLEALEEFVKACETAPPVELMGKIGNACRGAKHALAQARGEEGGL